MSPIQQKINYLGKNVPVIFRTDTNNISLINRRLTRESVQKKLVNQLGITQNNIKSISVQPDLPIDKFFRNGNISLSLDTALNLRGDKTAVVPSGAVDRGFAHIGMFEAIEMFLINPDIIVAASSGSIMGGIYSFYGDTDMLKKSAYNFVKNYSWQDVGDLYMNGLRDIKSCNGFISGEKLINSIGMTSRLMESDFKNTQKDFYVYAVDLNSGNGYVFCNYKEAYDKLVEDPRFSSKTLDRKFTTKIFEGDLLLRDAMRASIGMPGIFKPYKLYDINKREYQFTDGGIRQNCPVKTAASLIDVDKILAFNLGYSGQQVGGFMKCSPLDVFFQAQNIQGWNQLEALNDPIFKGISVRVVNPGLFNIKTPQAFFRAQDLIISARDTLEKLIETVTGRSHVSEKFFGKWSEGQINDLGKRMSVERWGGSDSNIYVIMDNDALIKKDTSEPVWQTLYSQDGGQLVPKKPGNNAAWMFKEMGRQFGWDNAILYSLWLLSNAAFLKIFFLKKN